MDDYPNHRSVLVLDNWRGHKNRTFLDACFDLDVVVEYGVPYAPDIMVHEPCGGAAKQVVKKNGKDWRDEGLSGRQQIEVAFKSVCPATVRAWAREFGYFNFE